MEESHCLRKPQKLLSDADMEEAAQQLMQLSDEESNNSGGEKRKQKREDFVKRRDEITWRKIEEIFGKEEEVDRPKRKRYRSLVSIYQVTKPVALEMGRRSRH